MPLVDSKWTTDQAGLDEEEQPENKKPNWTDQADDGMIHLDGFMRFMIETGSWDEDGPTPCLMHEHNELR